MAHGKNWRTFPGDIPGWRLRLYDPYAHALTVIPEEHRLAHDGMVFNTTHKATGVANGASLDVLIATNGEYVHLNRARVSVGAGDVDVVAYEGGNIAAGTPMVSWNTNRNSSNSPGTSFSYGPAVTTTGTIIHRGWIPPQGGGVGAQGGFSNLEAGEEWILKPSTNYLLRITNNSGGAIDILMDILWYEISYLNE